MRKIKALLAALTVTALAGAGLLVTSSAAHASTRIGDAAGALAAANENRHACDTNSLGGKAYEHSCVGYAGVPEYWCADFLKWVWENSGAPVDGINAESGTVYGYGSRHGTLHTELRYRPSVGDAVVYSYHGSNNADHVGIVVAVNSDGSLETENGDFDGQSGSEAHFASTSYVKRAHIAANQRDVGSVPSSVGQRISAYVTPLTPGNGGANVVADPSFESSGNGPWTCTGTCGVDHGLGFQHTGSSNGWVRHNSGWNDIHQTVTVQPNTTYHLTGWLRTSNNSDNGFFGVRTTADTVLGEENFGNINGYTFLQQDVNSGSNTQLVVYGGVWTDHGDIYLQLDDISLVAI